MADSSLYIKQQGSTVREDLNNLDPSAESFFLFVSLPISEDRALSGSFSLGVRQGLRLLKCLQTTARISLCCHPARGAAETPRENLRSKQLSCLFPIPHPIS